MRAAVARSARRWPGTSRGLARHPRRRLGPLRACRPQALRRRPLLSPDGSGHRRPRPAASAPFLALNHPLTSYLPGTFPATSRPAKRARHSCIAGIQWAQGSVTGANQRETRMGAGFLTRRRALQMAIAAGGLAAPAVRCAAAQAVTPKGKMVVAWHSNFAARWLDPPQQDR